MLFDCRRQGNPMPLERYRHERDRERTPGPFGGQARPTSSQNSGAHGPCTSDECLAQSEKASEFAAEFIGLSV
jgi:hypothetical protein